MTGRSGILLISISLFLGVRAFAAGVKIETAKMQLQLHNPEEVSDFLRQQWALPTVTVIERGPQMDDLPVLFLKNPQCPLQTLLELSKNQSVLSVESFLRYQFPVDSSGKKAGAMRIDNHMVLFVTLGPDTSNFTDQLSGFFESKEKQIFITECELKGRFPAPYVPFETDLSPPSRR